MRPFQSKLFAAIFLTAVAVSSPSKAGVITANIKFNSVIFEDTIYVGPYLRKVDIVDTLIGETISASFQINDLNNNFQLDNNETLFFDFLSPIGKIENARYIKNGDVLVGGGPNISNFQILPMPEEINSRQEYYFTAFVNLASFSELGVFGPTSAFSFVWGGDNKYLFGQNSYQWLEYDGSPPPPVPLPAAAWFLLTGLAGLAGLRFLKSGRQRKAEI